MFGQNNSTHESHTTEQKQDKILPTSFFLAYSRWNDTLSDKYTVLYEAGKMPVGFF